MKNRIFLTLFLLFYVFNVFCKVYHQNDFVNVLNIETGYRLFPQGYFFSDLGAWHGYGFNNINAKNILPGFRGPVFMGESSLGMQWLSDCLENISIYEEDNNGVLSQSNIDSLKQEYLPGMLCQTFKIGSLKVYLKNIFVSDRSSIIEYNLKNTSNERKKIKISFSGSLNYKNASLKKLNDNVLSININNGNHSLILSFPDEFKFREIEKSHYMVETSLMTLESEKSCKFKTVTTYSPGKSVHSLIDVHNKVVKSKSKSYFKENQKRWDGYLNKVLNKISDIYNSEENRTWMVKSIMTLNTNWRSAAGDIMHAGVQPAAGHFNAFWAWDSWEHAVALSLFNPELAKDQMRTMFDYQTKEGMIIDFVSFDKKENNISCSKPPIAGWATYMVYKHTKDKKFIQEMLPKLLKFHEWRYKYRDHDKNGLCEYGGIASHVYLGQYESGMDVAVKFDGVKMLKNFDGAYSFDQESVELNCYLCAEKFYLAYLFSEIGDKKTSDKLKNEGLQLKTKIQDNFFDSKTSYFYDRKITTGELVKVIDISGWIPLFTKVASMQQARAVKDNMLDEELFGNYFPFSSLNHKHELYQPDKGYFRGQTWMNYVYFGIRGWKNYGFEHEAVKYTNLLPKRLKGLSEKGAPIRENWNSATGDGMSAAHFSWSSAFSILLLTEDSDIFPYVPYN